MTSRWPAVRRFLEVFAVATTLLLPGNAAAFKLETHIWIGQQVLNDVVPDGTVTISPFGDFAVHQAIWQTLKKFPSAYRMGNVGPDGFPDLMGGQMTTHPGVDGAWQTDDWLEWIIPGAPYCRPRRSPLLPPVCRTSEALAFAYGYLAHAASDIFAHTYVNRYAGDSFDAQDEQEVELRHMALEDYIKKRTPPIRDHLGAALGRAENLVGVSDELAGFLRDRLVLDPLVAAQYRAAGADHLAAMHEFWQASRSALNKVDAVLGAINARIAALASQVAAVDAHLDSLIARVPGYPLTCFAPLPFFAEICGTIVATRLALEAVQLSLEVTMRANEMAADSVRWPLELWKGEIEEAARQYMLTSGEVAREIMKADLVPKGDPRAKLSRWLCEYAPAFAGVPSEVNFPLCAAQDRAREMRDGIDGIRREVSRLLGALGWFVDPLQKLTEVVEDLKRAGVFTRLAAALTDENSVLVSLVRLRTQLQTAETLNAEFAADGSSKGLVTFDGRNAPLVAPLADADMGLTAAGHFDPARFNAVHNAIVLSKLVLLDASELNRLVRTAGVTTTIYGTDLYQDTPPLFNPLFGAVRSIDGNEQWQEAGLPYPRQGDAVEVADHEYGYPYNRGLGLGFRLWQDCEVREKVFKRIFRGPVTPQLEALLYGLGGAPFPLSPGSRDPLKVVPVNGVPSVICGGPPDLIISAFSAPSAAAPGAQIVISDTTTNSGSGAAAATRTAFYLSTTTSPGPGAVLLQRRQVPGLDAGGSQGAVTQVRIPPDTPPGLFWLIAVADADLQHPESNDGNNASIRQISVGGADPGLVAPTNLTARASGRTVTLQWQDAGGSEDAFVIERRRGTAVFKRVGEVAGGTTTFVQTVAAGSYRYRVRAVDWDTGATSPWSNVARIQVP